jgi:hypothetical protein
MSPYYAPEAIQKSFIEKNDGWVWWLMPFILATRKAEIRRITIQGQPRQKVSKTLISNNKSWVWWQVPVIPAIQEA